MLMKNTPIYAVKLMMGHASVTTTEQYSSMNLKRAAQDFPTLVDFFEQSPGIGKMDTDLMDTEYSLDAYVPLYQQIKG